VGPETLAALPTEALHPLAEDLELLDGAALARCMQVVDHAVLPALDRLAEPLGELIERVAQRLAVGGRLRYVGAGTSGRLGVLDAVECQPTFGLPPGIVSCVIAGGEAALLSAVEGAEDDLVAGARAALDGTMPGDVIVGIAASGRTPFVTAALEAAHAGGRQTALICCSPPAAALASCCDIVLHAAVGPELIAGSTRLKAGTATKLLLNRLSTGAMIRLGKTYRGRMVDLQPACAKLVARAVRIVCELARVDAQRAQTLLEHAGWRVKLALAMALLDSDATYAQQQLENVAGNLAELVR
jgi:N-acetylmuramic acid 6-phosphate etherase